MPTYQSQSNWSGTLQTGSGRVTVSSGAFDAGISATPQDQQATNPEEIIGAALASCYGLMLAKTLGDHDVLPQEIKTNASVGFDLGDDTPRITEIALEVGVKAADLDQERLNELAQLAESRCAVANALGGTTLSVDAKINNN